VGVAAVPWSLPHAEAGKRSKALNFGIYYVLRTLEGFSLDCCERLAFIGLMFHPYFHPLNGFAARQRGFEPQLHMISENVRRK
jgi:hypothetical protein